MSRNPAGPTVSDPKHRLVAPDGMKATAYDAQGNDQYGHLEADEDGVVRFVNHFPDHKPGTE